MAGQCDLARDPKAGNGADDCKESNGSLKPLATTVPACL